MKRQIDFSKEKEKLATNREKQEALTHLQSSIERGILNLQDIKHVLLTWTEVKNKVSEILGKIDEIDRVTDIDTILPAHLRITRQEYEAALTNEEARMQALLKVNHALDHLATLLQGEMGFWGINFFSFFHPYTAKNKNIILVQEHTIDIKDDLINPDSLRSL